MTDINAFDLAELISEYIESHPDDTDDEIKNHFKKNGFTTTEVRDAWFFLVNPLGFDD